MFNKNRFELDIFHEAVIHLLSLISKSLLSSGLSRLGCIAVLVLFNSCLDSYTLNIDGYDNLLVVDGLITDENKSHDITLTRSTSDMDEDSPYETGAMVYVTDSNGVMYYFEEYSSGIYSSDSTDLIVKEGDKYTLHIQTEDGVTYESDECEVLPKSTIDSVYYKKDSDWDDSGENLNEGISFYIDGSSDNASSYGRILYDEDWKFKTPYYERLIILEDGTSETVWPIKNRVCWKHVSSSDIDVFSMGDQVGSVISGKHVAFVGSDLSDRLLIRYCIGVKLLTISKEEYEYWRKLNESTEEIDDVFAKQPYSVTGNVYNEEDENEPVLGCFQVGSVAFKRLYVNNKDLDGLDLPTYSDTCELKKVDTDFFDSYYKLYVKMVINGHFCIYSIAQDGSVYLAWKVCADCTKTGNINMPDFWEEE